MATTTKQPLKGLTEREILVIFLLIDDFESGLEVTFPCIKPSNYFTSHSFTKQNLKFLSSEK